MRLADFILANVEPILREWDAFARSMPVGAVMTDLALRDHGEEILRATVADMAADQSTSRQHDKSAGKPAALNADARLDIASDVHAIARVDSGFELLQVVAEYRALRASVL